MTPGITIRDRLRVLLPNDPDNYYRIRDITPPDLREKLARAKILITNFHAFLPRETTKAGKLHKQILHGHETGAFRETPSQMVRRVCRELGGKKNILVLNDEAHHCYRRKPDGEEVKLKGDERKEAEKRDEEARIWISGVEAVKQKLGIKRIVDLSATPFFLRGSGYPEGTLFPWVVSDFSLIDAIESGVVKIPRVPVADDQMRGDMPTYRNLWERVRDHLPRKGRRKAKLEGEPKLPAELEGALHSLYSNYENDYRIWEKSEGAKWGESTPPVFIVVCNNTNVSKLVYDYIAGWDKPVEGQDQPIPVPGKLSLFSNVRDGHWLGRPNTVLVDSEQLESGDAMSADFKKIASREIEKFKREYRIRFPERDIEKLTDEDLLREVMNTVGKQGKLGEQIRCVVSVSMLTEGWDANTVTHILGVRAFGTQLLCEQVVGRALRRISYAPNDDGKYELEYAEVYGVPFSFIPCSGSTTEPKPPKKSTRVHALEERAEREIVFPRIVGYRWEIGSERLEAEFTAKSKMSLSPRDIPTKTEMMSCLGGGSVHGLDDLRRTREAEVAFHLAHRVLEMLQLQVTSAADEDDRQERPWLFPQVLAISKRWVRQCVECVGGAFVQLLRLRELGDRAADHIYNSILGATAGQKTLKAIPRPYDKTGSTRYVDFDTTRPTWSTPEDKCHVSHVVADTDSWEQKTAQVLEEMPEVYAYVKNDGMDFTIPYTLAGEQRQYRPDFLVRYDDGQGAGDLLNLIVEVSGEGRTDKQAKVATAQTLWIPSVNNHAGFGRWAFVEIVDPWKDADEVIRGAARSVNQKAA